MQIPRSLYQKNSAQYPLNCAPLLNAPLSCRGGLTVSEEVTPRKADLSYPESRSLARLRVFDSRLFTIGQSLTPQLFAKREILKRSHGGSFPVKAKIPPATRESTLGNEFGVPVEMAVNRARSRLVNRRGRFQGAFITIV